MNIPLTKPYITIEEEKAIIRVLRSGWLMQGTRVEKFEHAVSQYIDVPYGVAVSSGTAALHLALLALGIKQGDEVIVPSFSFIASANCILYVGATPVFADIDEKTYNIDPHDVATKITKRTKAVIAVHQIGLSADIDPLKRLCKKHGFYLVEDAACALGATYKGKKVGGFGDVGCFSFHPRKSITTGEGGLLTTNSNKIAQMLKSLRSHGVKKKDDKEVYDCLGYNYRLTDMQAAIGLVQLQKLPWILKRRQELAGHYSEELGQIPGITVPYIPKCMTHTYQSYMVRFPSEKVRNQVAHLLTQKGIAIRRGIMAIHQEPLYQNLSGNISLPVTEQITRNSLILPLYPQMTRKEQDYVMEKIKEGMVL